LYQANGSLASRKAVIASLLSLILALPVVFSAYAESFTVTSNKDIYTADENAIIVGAVPMDAPEGYAVLIRVTGPDGSECSLQNLLRAGDNSFVSRPVRLDACGMGQYRVSAYYADMNTTSMFTVSNNSRVDANNGLELRLLKNAVLQAQDVVNQKLNELVEAGYPVQEEVAEKYSSGVSETSLTLQAIEFRDAAEAKKHMIFAIRHLREVLDALSSERVIFDQITEQRAVSDSSESDSSAGSLEKYNRLKVYYYRLEELTEKNGANRESDFKSVASILASSKEMIDEGEIAGAERNFARVDELLEEIRADLFESGEEEQQGNNQSATQNASNSTGGQDNSGLASLADRYEQRALDLLWLSRSSAEAEAKIQEALSFIPSARASIEGQNYESARVALSAALNAVNEARKIIDEGESDDGGAPSESESAGNNTSSSQDGNEGSENSGEGSKGGNDTGDDQ
jgi:hypothetical protein